MNVKILANKALLGLRKNSPKILVGTSIVGGIGSVALAIKATPQAVRVINEHRENRAWFNEINEKHLKFNEKTNTYDEYTEKQYKNDVKKLYLKTGSKLVKLYLPSGLCLASSVASTVASHNIMAGRNKVLSNQLGAAIAQAAAYRTRVKEALGEDKEQELWENNKKTESVNLETGKKEEAVLTQNNGSRYSVCFAEYCNQWDNNASLNVEFLLSTENYFTDKLRRTGVVFLDEVYKLLGITVGQIGEERMKEAHIVGWIYDPDNQMIDNYVSFGLRNPDGTIKRTTMYHKTHNEPNIWLDFNVCGDIFNQPRGTSYTKFIK